MTLLAITPLEDEFEALRGDLETEHGDGRVIEIGRLSGLSFLDGALVVSSGGLGKAQFGVQTQHMLDHLDGVRLAVCAGTAGGLSQALAVGDVVAATHTVEHDFNALSTTAKPEFEGHGPALSALSEAAGRDGRAFQIHLGKIASGDEGIAGERRAQELMDATGAIAVAWEGAGGARAAAFSGVPFLELRGISDGAREGSFEEFKRNIPNAMRSVATVLTELVAAL